MRIVLLPLCFHYFLFMPYLFPISLTENVRGELCHIKLKLAHSHIFIERKQQKKRHPSWNFNLRNQLFYRRWKEIDLFLGVSFFSFSLYFPFLAQSSHPSIIVSEIVIAWQFRSALFQLDSVGNSIEWHGMAWHRHWQQTPLTTSDTSVTCKWNRAQLINVYNNVSLCAYNDTPLCVSVCVCVAEWQLLSIQTTNIVWFV